jgi:hypothetical protein
MDDIETIVEGKLEADTDFQTSLADLSDDDKNSAIATKRKELLNAEFKALADGKTAAEKIASDQKIRAEKAEKAKKQDDGGGDAPQTPVLSPKDTYAMQQAGVHLDDFDDIVEGAGALKISVTEYLKKDFVGAMLKDKAEKRKTADATNTGTKRPSQKTTSDEQLLADASAGKMPEKGTAEAERLFWLRRGGKK